MEIEEITAEDAPLFIKDIAKIHALSYSGAHFSATFGEAKLEEYNSLLVRNSDLSLVALEGVTPVGFIISGTALSRGVQQFTRENRLFLVGRLLRHPRFLVAKIYGKLSSAFRKNGPPTVHYRLLSIATSPSAQSKGIGTALLVALEERLAARGVKRYGLSVRIDNPRAVEFYRRNGFVVEKEQLGSLYFTKEIA